jgi:hypothetical protein
MNDTFITKLHIHAVRHLKDIEIELSPATRKHLVVTGGNGSGKTALIRAVGALLSNGGLAADRPPTVACLFNAGIEWPAAVRANQLFVALRKAAAPLILLQPAGVHLRPTQGPPAPADEPLSFLVQYLVELQSIVRTDPRAREGAQQWLSFCENVLRKLFNDDALTLKFDHPAYPVVITLKHQELVVFSDLSDGYVAAIALFGELLMLFDHIYGKCRTAQGIVLLDDLEMFLDIERQEKILPLLIESFPNVQFLITTRSPVVLHSSTDTIIYDLENRIRCETPTDYRYDAFLVRYAEIGRYSAQIKQMIDEYERLLNKKEKTEPEEFRVIELRNYLTWILHKMC